MNARELLDLNLDDEFFRQKTTQKKYFYVSDEKSDFAPIAKEDIQAIKQKFLDGIFHIQDTTLRQIALWQALTSNTYIGYIFNLKQGSYVPSLSHSKNKKAIANRLISEIKANGLRLDLDLCFSLEHSKSLKNDLKKNAPFLYERITETSFEEKPSKDIPRSKEFLEAALLGAKEGAFSPMGASGPRQLELVKKYVAAYFKNTAALNAFSVLYHGKTALILAVERANIEIIDVLLSSPHTNVSAKDFDGRSAAHCSVFINNLPEARLNILGKLLARMNDIPEIEQLLLERPEPEFHRALTERINQLRGAQNQIPIEDKEDNHLGAAVRFHHPEVDDEPGSIPKQAVKTSEQKTPIIVVPTYSERLQKLRDEGYVIQYPEDYDLDCPISLDIMNDPIAIAGSGKFYDRESIKNWFNTKKMELGDAYKGEINDPVTRLKISENELNNPTATIIKKQIEKFVSEQEEQARIWREQKKQQIQSQTTSSESENLTESIRDADEYFEDQLLPSNYPSTNFVGQNAQLPSSEEVPLDKKDQHNQPEQNQPHQGSSQQTKVSQSTEDLVDEKIVNKDELMRKARLKLLGKSILIETDEAQPVAQPRKGSPPRK